MNCCTKRITNKKENSFEEDARKGELHIVRGKKRTFAVAHLANLAKLHIYTQLFMGIDDFIYIMSYRALRP